jgi:hypothetical protein
VGVAVLVVAIVNGDELVASKVRRLARGGAARSEERETNR